jgi:hypothetical protein
MLFGEWAIAIPKRRLSKSGWQRGQCQVAHARKSEVLDRYDLLKLSYQHPM